MKWVTFVSMFALEEALKGRLKVIPFDSIEALDVVLRYSLSSQYISIGRSFFSPPVRNMNSANLECGREVWFGFHQSVRPSEWKMLVNIDCKLAKSVEWQVLLYML